MKCAATNIEMSGKTKASKRKHKHIYTADIYINMKLLHINNLASLYCLASNVDPKWQNCDFLAGTFACNGPLIH
jgi:hypothetical protein